MAVDFNLAPEQQELVTLVRRLAREKVAPRAAAIDEEGRYPEEIFQLFREAGLLGLAIPEAYGGAGMGTLGLCLAVEQVAQYCCASGLMLLLSKLPLMPIMLGGTEEQKRKYAGGIAAGTLRGAFCLSEPDAGSDAANIRTRAVRKGDRWVISGTKSWISGAGQADFFTVAAQTEPGTGARGMVMFLVEKGTPGLTVGKKERKMGVRGVPVHQVILEEVEVPETAMLGTPGGAGFKVVMGTLGSVRPVVAARGLGLAEGAMMAAVEYGRQRQTFGKPILEHQGLQWMLADLAARLEGARLLTYRAAIEVDAGHTGKADAWKLSVAKLSATELAAQAATDCLQILGAAGYMQDYPMERHYRDVKQLQIVEGTSQIQKNIIGRAILEGDLHW
ncbi:MAG TPA: acyl-CoA dehydrogenase family protein [Symbiobacteriaceae bacterium]|nr:acyl-CoA dehydrogenase family protein [Symbiobacteriaceae bacterium]